MICSGKALGIVSYGHEKCGSYPGVYTRLEPFIQWMTYEDCKLSLKNHSTWTDLSLLCNTMIFYFFMAVTLMALVYIKFGCHFKYLSIEAAGNQPTNALLQSMNTENT